MRILKFFGSSVIATGADLSLYSGLICFLTPTIANIISAGVGLLINFTLQHKFVFNPSNPIFKSFILSLIFSLCGLVFGTSLIYLFTNYTILKEIPIIAKIITIGIIFFYNYFTRKFAFGHKEDKVDRPC
ncbi:MAG: GtrA family protein [Deltaproteobacteria bacterium]|uniref:GtrA family protein n=1 Tax=Desulfobacula sp. TaxID=2593537 RepID=UPI0019A535F5|nr:GtrA family protein [Candidatus Desulfobacula maris]MBL6993970.1 GtrA family protein [Desulfobacula sp.]